MGLQEFLFFSTHTVCYTVLRTWSTLNIYSQMIERIFHQNCKIHDLFEKRLNVGQEFLMRESKGESPKEDQIET